MTILTLTNLILEIDVNADLKARLQSCPDLSAAIATANENGFGVSAEDFANFKKALMEIQTLEAAGSAEESEAIDKELEDADLQSITGGKGMPQWQKDVWAKYYSAPPAAHQQLHNNIVNMYQKAAYAKANAGPSFGDKVAAFFVNAGDVIAQSVNPFNFM